MPTSPSPARALLRRYGIPVGVAVLLAGGAGVALASQASHPAAQAAPSPSASAPVIGLMAPTGSPSSGTSGTTSSAQGQVPSAGPASTGTGQSGTQPSASPSAVPTAPKYADGGSQQGPSLAPWMPTARGFAAAWADPSGGKDAWLARMAPYVTPDLLKQFGYTNISNVHADTLKAVTLDEESGPNLKFSGTFTNQGYAMDGIMVVQPDGTWRVSQIGAPSK